MIFLLIRTTLYLFLFLLFKMRSLLSFTTIFIPKPPSFFRHPIHLPFRRHSGTQQTTRTQSSPAKTATIQHTALSSSSSSSSPPSLSSLQSYRPQVSIIGGGFGGLFTTLRLLSLPWTRLTHPEITLIDRSDRFVFSPMLYELVVGDVEHWEIAPFYTELLHGTGAKFVKMNIEEVVVDRNGEVKEKNKGGEQDVDDIRSRSGGDGSSGGLVRGVGENGEERVVSWNNAVVALGTEGIGWNGPGDGQVMGFKSVGDAIALKERLRELMGSVGKERLVRMVVIGGGYSGVELAATVAERFEGKVEVMLVERGDRVLKSGTGWNRKVGERTLEEQGVLVEYRANVREVRSGEIVLQRRDSQEPTVHQADVVVWTAGVKPNSILDTIDVGKDDRGRLVVDERLQIRGNEKMLALGDCTTVQGPEGQYGGTAQVAMQQAEYAAWNMWARITGKPMLNYRYSHLGEMMVLGSSNATLSTPFGIDLDGSLAHAIRRAAYLIRLPTDNHRAKVAVSWATTPIINALGSVLGSYRRRSPEL